MLRVDSTGERLNIMAEQFRVTVLGEAKGPWRDARSAAMEDAIALKLASWDASAREWFLSAPVDIERQGSPDPLRGYPSRPARHREAWNAEDLRKLRQLVDAGSSLTDIARQLGRTQETCRTRARLLGLAIARTPRRR